MNYFTADTHFGHKNIVGPEISVWSSGYRNFSTVRAMDEHIVNELNTVVGEDDTLYFLGDLTFKGGQTIRQIRERINCKTIHFILGNHDKERQIRESGCFTSVQDVLRTTLEGHEFFMSHYAHRVWPNYHRKSIHLFGHSHSSLEGTEWGLSMDVGIDNYYRLYGHYRPFSLEEILYIMSTRELQKFDKHAEFSK